MININLKNYVLDASVVVKWLSPIKEENLEQARFLLKNIEAQAIEVYSSDLLIHEVGNALWKGKGLNEKDLNIAIETFFDLEINFVSTDYRIAVLTYKIAREYNITFYDAVYAALARSLNCQLITANSKCHLKIKDGSVIDLQELQGSAQL